jgi:hypothetical protein
MKGTSGSKLWLGLSLAASLIPGCLGSPVLPIVHEITRTVDACNLVETFTKIYIIEPVHVNTYMQENTTFAINDHLTITVDNAPTSFDGVVKGTSTTLITSSYNMHGASLAK